jgi:hypothetical protein
VAEHYKNKPHGRAHMQPTSIPKTWGHAVGGYLNATKAREFCKYGKWRKRLLTQRVSDHHLAARVL